MWVDFVAGSRPCCEGFSPVSAFFLLPQKLPLLNPNSIGNLRATGLSVAELLRVSLFKQSRFIYLFCFIFRLPDYAYETSLAKIKMEGQNWSEKPLALGGNGTQYVAMVTKLWNTARFLLKLGTVCVPI